MRKTIGIPTIGALVWLQRFFNYYGSYFTLLQPAGHRLAEPNFNFLLMHLHHTNRSENDINAIL
jgi:hypothetical protein